MKANCPSCGAEVLFKTSIAVFSVCGHCRSMLVRHDMDLEALGKMAQLPEDISPLKIGTRGKYNSANFEIIGRLKVAWSEGCWNEWFIMFEDGKQGWLAEAMGFFMLSYEVEETDNLPKLAEIKLGSNYPLAAKLTGRTYFVDDIKEAVCIGSEGELPFKGLSGRRTTSVDLSGDSGKFACIEYSEQDGVRLYVGSYVDFDNLGLSNLRDLSADLKKIRSIELFKCPSCGGPISMLTPGITVAVVCKYCGSTIDATNKNLTILNKAEKKITIKPLLPIGSKGKLFEAEWEITGFMRRADEEGNYPWDEYLLFNPTKGVRWLTSYNGHWNFIEMLRNRRIGDGSEAFLRFGDKSFRRFNSGKAKVLYVLGEFYWRVKTGDLVELHEFISPPEVLSCEIERSERIWSLGNYVEPQLIREAFGIKEELPPRVGVASNQPSPYARGNNKWGNLYFFIFAALLTILQLYFAFAARDLEIFAGKFTFNPRRIASPIVTAAFEIPGDSDNLSLTLMSPVSNDWIEASFDLVNADTKKSLEFAHGVEYYSGSDSDGSWTEGSQTSEFVLSSVPGGRYNLVIQPSSSTSTDQEKSFTLKLRRGVTTWNNYFIALLLLAVYPVCTCWRRCRFELKRNAESNLAQNTAGDEKGD